METLASPGYFTGGVGNDLTLAGIKFPIEGARILRDPPCPLYRCIAGPYYSSEQWMLHNALKSLRGCTVAIAEAHCGICIYRLTQDLKFD